MKTIKLMIVGALMALAGSSAWAYNAVINVSISPGASIKIANNYTSTQSWTAFLSTSTSSPTSGSESLNGLTISPTRTTSSTRSFVTTITASDSATVGTVVYAYARRGTSSSNGCAYKITVVDPLRIASGETVNGVAGNSGNTWQVGETSDPNSVITVTPTSGSSRNVNITAANKTGEAACWMTNRTTTAGYYAYKVYVGPKVEDIVISNAVVLANGGSQVLTNNLGQAIAWSDRTDSTSDDPDIAQVVNIDGLAAMSSTTNVGRTTVTVMTSGTNYHFTVYTVVAEIEKTIKPAIDTNPNDKSNVTVRVTTHTNCGFPSIKTNNILYVGSGCITHGLSRDKLATALNTLATKGKVDWFIFGHHKVEPTNYEPQCSGTLNYGETVNASVLKLATGTDDSAENIWCNNLKSYLLKLKEVLHEEHDNYDYIVLSFDANLLAIYYDEYEGWGNKYDQDDPDINEEVAEKLLWYYENDRVIWLHAPLNGTVDTNPPQELPYEEDLNYYRPNSAIDAVEWFERDWGADWAITAEPGRGWDAFVALLDPETYLEKPSGQRYTDTMSYSFTDKNGKSNTVTVYAANGINQQADYDDADKVAKVIEEYIPESFTYDMNIADTIVNLNESLSVKGNRFYVWNGETAPETQTDATHKVIADLPINATHWALLASSASGGYAVSTNLADVTGEQWYMYEIDVVDNGTFLDECLQQVPPRAILDEATGKYLVNPNDGLAHLTLFATINGERKAILAEDAALMTLWEREGKAQLVSLWITDHADAGTNKVHLQFEPTFDKPVSSLPDWASTMNAAGRLKVAWGKDETELQTNIDNGTYTPATLRAGTFPASDRRVWITADVPANPKDLRYCKIVIPGAAAPQN